MADIIVHIKALIQYRHLLWSLAIKDIKVRYRSPTLGFLWTIIIPLTMVLIYKFVFSGLLRAPDEGYPYFIYLMTAVFPWTYFSSSIGAAVESIFSNRELIKKTYFPRQIIPVSVVLANLLNFLPAIVTMILLLAFFRMQFTIFILLLPVVLLIQTILTIGLALIFSSLQIMLRDIKYIVELLLMAWLFLSPGFYSLTTVANYSETFFKIYLLNPFAGLFILYRIALLKNYADTLPPQVNVFLLSLWSIIVSVAVFFLGFLVFKKYERYFSDLL